MTAKKARKRKSTDLDKLEARVLRRVAAALRGAYRSGYYGHGGPQDGDDIPPSFDATTAAGELDRAADALEALDGLAEDAKRSGADKLTTGEVVELVKKVRRQRRKKT